MPEMKDFAMLERIKMEFSSLVMSKHLLSYIRSLLFRFHYALNVFHRVPKNKM